MASSLAIMGYLSLVGRSKCADLTDDRRERGRIRDRDIGKNLAVEPDLGLFEGCDQTAVADVIVAGGGREARDPELAEVALLGAAVAERVNERAIDGFSRSFVFIFAAEDEARGSFQNFIVASATFKTTFCA